MPLDPSEALRALDAALPSRASYDPAAPRAQAVLCVVHLCAASLEAACDASPATRVLVGDLMSLSEGVCRDDDGGPRRGGRGHGWPPPPPPPPSAFDVGRVVCGIFAKHCGTVSTVGSSDKLVDLALDSLEVMAVVRHAPVPALDDV